MQMRFGVFKWQPQGFPDWLEWAMSADHAKQRVEELAGRSVDIEFFAQDFVANTIVASSAEYRQKPKRMAFHA